jgi:outer membrane protein OmpA-like peptidoglycan-associated protein
LIGHATFPKIAPVAAITSHLQNRLAIRALQPQTEILVQMTRIFLPAAAALCLVLGACSSDEQKSTAESSAPAKTSEGEKVPNLASVPDQPPPSTPKVERDKLVQGLLADRAHAEYTDQKLGEDTANVAAATPPPPAPPAPDSAAKPADGGSGEQTESSADKPAEQPTPAAPTEVAALPVDLGQPTALIYFAGDTAILTDRDRAILSDVASQYKGERSSRVRVIGHASATEKTIGTSSEGTDLALARADAVAKTLIGMGVPAKALETSTGGATYDESMETGVAANRRVAIYIGS